MTTHEVDQAGIAAVIERYRAGFESMDPELLITIWDRQHHGLVYVAQEMPEPIRGWTQIEAYYRGLPTANPADRVTEMRVDDLTIDTLGDVALAFCLFHFEGLTTGRREPFIADGRVTFVLHRTAQSWKVVHYHESGPPDRPDDGV